MRWCVSVKWVIASTPFLPVVTGIVFIVKGNGMSPIDDASVYVMKSYALVSVACVASAVGGKMYLDGGALKLCGTLVECNDGVNDRGVMVLMQIVCSILVLYSRLCSRAKGVSFLRTVLFVWMQFLSGFTGMVLFRHAQEEGGCQWLRDAFKDTRENSGDGFARQVRAHAEHSDSDDFVRYIMELLQSLSMASTFVNSCETWHEVCYPFALLQAGLHACFCFFPPLGPLIPCLVIIIWGVPWMSQSFGLIDSNVIQGFFVAFVAISYYDMYRIFTRAHNSDRDDSDSDRDVVTHALYISGYRCRCTRSKYTCSDLKDDFYNFCTSFILFSVIFVVPWFIVYEKFKAEKAPIEGDPWFVVTHMFCVLALLSAQCKLFECISPFFSTGGTVQDCADKLAKSIENLLTWPI
jgi:hypothetical protein